MANSITADIKQEIINVVHNTIDFCGNVQQAVADTVGVDICREDVQQVIFEATMSWGK